MLTYDEIGTNLAFGELDALQLAEGPGLRDLLQTAVARLDAGDTFGLSVDYAAGGAAIRETLAAHPRVGIRRPRPQGDTLVVDLTVDPVGAAPVTDAVHDALDLALAVLRQRSDPADSPDAAEAPAADGDERPAALQPPEAVDADPLPETDAPGVPAPLLRDEIGGHTRTAVVAGLITVAALAGAAVVAAVVEQDGLTDLTLVLLVLTLVAGQLALGALVVALLRAQHRLHADQLRLGRRTRRLVDRRTRHLLQQGGQIGERVDALAPLRDYVLELARVQVEDTVRTEEALARLRTEQDDDR